MVHTGTVTYLRVGTFVRVPDLSNPLNSSSCYYLSWCNKNTQKRHAKLSYTYMYHQVCSVRHSFWRNNFFSKLSLGPGTRKAFKEGLAVLFDKKGIFTSTVSSLRLLFFCIHVKSAYIFWMPGLSDPMLFLVEVKRCLKLEPRLFRLPYSFENLPDPKKFL
jgi:hypothetical protein